MSKVLVTGGAGYIGSITASILADAGYTPVIFDSLENGHRSAVREFELIEGDLRNFNSISAVFDKHEFDAVVHFAAYLDVNESVNHPIKYFDNNVHGSLNLFNSMVDHQVTKLVFSSTCATYGQPEKLPVTETEKEHPESPYGESKLMVEKILAWLGKQKQLNSIRLRYFNVAGALPDGSMGEDHRPEKHIIPLAISVAMGRLPHFTMFGDDYDTPDGTCIRDYIHVVDLAQAHVDALKKLKSFQGSDYFNVGVGQGYSNREIVRMVEEVSGKKLEVRMQERREGDPPKIFADSSKLRRELNWNPKYGLADIVESAWKWHSAHPQGYLDN
jgi:UDP-glucose 4-epimerase